MPTITCQNADQLSRFLIGDVRADEAARIEEHLEQCDRCSGMLDELHAEDPLVEAMRMAPATSTRFPQGERIDRFMDELCRAGTQDSRSDRSTVDSGSMPAATREPENYDFLAPPQQPDEMGRLGEYRILKLLGKGGMGAVFLAEDPGLQRQVAIKVMKPDLAVKASARERFLREAQAAAALDHDHVVAVHYVGEQNGVPFLSMPLLKGMSLSTCIKRNQTLSVAQILRIGRETASGLAAAHEIGLIHRDVKPANLWLESKAGGRVKILDFGLARPVEDNAHLTNSGAFVGTPAYVAPEQARGEAIDARADLFSLGCVLYRLCTGRAPFTGNTTMAVLTSLAVDTPSSIEETNPDVPSALIELVMQLLAKDPNDRPASAKAVVEAIRSIERSLTSSAPSRTEVIAVSVTPTLEETASYEPSPSMLAAKSEAQQSGRQRSSGKRRGLLIAATLLLVLGPLTWLYGATVLRFATNKGVLVVEIDDPDVEVGVKQGSVKVHDPSTKRTYELTATDGQIEVYEKGGNLKLLTKAFTLRRGGKTYVRVTLQDLAKARGKPKGVEDSDRRAAEYVLSIGGAIRVNDQESYIEAVTDLPKELFRLTFIQLSDNPKVTDAGLAVFRECRNLKGLALHDNPQITDRGLRHFEHCIDLTNLGLRRTQISDAGLACFSQCKKLQTVGIPHTEVTDAGIVHLKDLHELTHLSLSGTKVTDVGLAHFSACGKLEILALEDLKVTGKGLHLKAWPNLSTLVLDRTLVTDTDLKQVADCNNLWLLGLTGTGVTDRGLAHLAKLRKLVFLTLGHTEVTDVGLDHLKGLKLGGLGLRKTKVTAKGVAALQKALPNCKIEWDGNTDPDRRAAEWVLSVGATIRLDDLETSYNDVPKLPDEPFKLTYVNLQFSQKVTEEGLALLKQCTGLTHLYLARSNVTDAELAQVKDCKELTLLELRRTAVTDAGLAHLKGLKKLRHLDLTSSKVTPEGVAELRKALPQCEILRNGNADANRRAANHVVSFGGKVGINGGERNVQ